MNFSSFGNPSSEPAQSSVGVLNLSKGQTLDLTKKEPALKKCVLGAGWDVAQRATEDYDLDIAVFLLGSDGKVHNAATDVVFFNQMKQQGICLEGDNRTGEGDGDDERIDIDLDSIAPNVQKLVFVVTIFEAASKHQTFGMVQNSFVRLVNAENDKELCRFELKDNFSTETAVVFAEMERTSNGWTFKAIGEGLIADLNGVLGRYV